MAATEFSLDRQSDRIHKELSKFDSKDVSATILLERTKLVIFWYFVETVRKFFHDLLEFLEIYRRTM